MPREAASQRTFLLFNKDCQPVSYLNTRDHVEALVLSSSASAGGRGWWEVHREAISSPGSGPRLSGVLGSFVQGRSVDDGVDVRMAGLFW